MQIFWAAFGGRGGEVNKISPILPISVRLGGLTPSPHPKNTYEPNVHRRQRQFAFSWNDQCSDCCESQSCSWQRRLAVATIVFGRWSLLTFGGRLLLLLML